MDINKTLKNLKDCSLSLAEKACCSSLDIIHKCQENFADEGVDEPIKEAFIEVPNTEQVQEPFTEKAQEPQMPLSLLDNSPYMSLVDQCRQIYEELERMEKHVSNLDTLGFIDMQKARIRESLLLSGASIIDGDTEFNLLRHTSISNGIITNGASIEETLEAGVEIEGRVIIKCKVRTINN